MRDSVIQRLFAKVEKTDYCWNWIGGSTRYGHGRIKIDGKLHSPHRVIYEHYNGSLLAGMMVCHRCDNPACVRPSHLFVGNGSSNMQDCAAKGRMAVQRDPSFTQGERRATSKLTDQSVREIRRLAGAVPVKKMAETYHVHRSIIQKVIKGERWKHVY